MTGFYFQDKCLVTRSYKDDGIFFLIYLVMVIFFIVKEKIGKWIMIGWLMMWFITQFLCHEWYTIFNSGLLLKTDTFRMFIIQFYNLMSTCYSNSKET